MKALKISLLILSSLYGNTILAQYSDHRNRQVDSLEQILATNPPTGVKLVEMYNSLAWGYRPDRDKAMDYARRSVAVALPLDEWSWVTNGYMLLGLHHYRSVQYDSTLFYYGKALEAAERMKDFPKRFDQRTIDDRLSVIYGNMANLYNIQSDLHMAVEYYLRALALFEKHGWRNGEANVYYNVGEMYLAMQNYEQAELNYRQFDTISREIGDSLFMALANSGLSMIELEKKDYNRALEYADAAGTYFFAHPEETDNRVVILNMLAQIHLEGYGDIDRAEEYVRQALQLTQTDEVMTVTQAATLGLHAEIHLRRGEWRAARDAALASLALDDQEFTNTLPAYEVLAKAYGKLGDTGKAWEYFDRHDSLQTSWATRNYQSAIREMETRFETEKKETRIATLEDEKRLVAWLGIAAGAVLLLASAALFFLWRWTAGRRRIAQQQVIQLEQEKQFVATQALLDGEVQERIRLARDLHDGLGSLLSATRLNFEGIQKDVPLDAESKKRFETAIGTLDESMHEMRRVAHHLMPDALVRFGLKTALSDFCTTIPSAEFVYYGYEQRFDRKLEVVVYRIAHELINNALRHAGAERILVQIVQEADRVALTVQDDGRGFDPATETQGMGLQSIRARVASFGGTMDLRSSVENGTEINVQFQINS